MAPDRRATWTWEVTTPARSGSSGDISKLFRHEQTKNPGVFAVDAPPADATLMAREVIQNSWDAAREFQDEDPDAPEFQIDFGFKQLEGDEKRALVEALDLHNLSARADESDRIALGLREEDCLSTLDGLEPLTTLVIEERATTGMYGPWTNADSRMYLALVSLGYTEKAGAGAGGSYGFGKAGLIRGSATRTVVAYTCFRERPGDPGVTRRLLGMTYWGQHDHAGMNFTGFGRYGESTEAGDEIRPFENEAADEVAVSLGLEGRDPSDPEDLGTTFLLIEPTVEPLALVRAVARSWWPALTENLFEVTVREPNLVHHPRPMRDEVLRSFAHAYEVAMTARDNPNTEEKRIAFSALEVDGERIETLGNLGLTVDLQGWSYADQTEVATDEETIGHRSLVALMRGPRMVVEYLVVGRSSPYVRGVFVADGAIDDDLLRTEPKAHDAWQTTSEEGGAAARAAEIARTALSRVRVNVANFRKLHKPPIPPPEDLHLPYFDSIMRKVMAGPGAGWKPPVQDTRPVSIRLAHAPEPAGDGLVRITGTATLSLSDHFEGDEGPIEVSIYYRFLEDDRVGEFADLTFDVGGPLTPADRESGMFAGTLAKGEVAEIGFESAPYSAEWSGRLIVNASPVKATAEVEE